MTHNVVSTVVPETSASRQPGSEVEESYHGEVVEVAADVLKLQGKNAKSVAHNPEPPLREEQVLEKTINHGFHIKVDTYTMKANMVVVPGKSRENRQVARFKSQESATTNARS